MQDHRITGDYHTHTYYSHGTGSPRENVLAAIDRGLDEIAISEHGPGHFSYGVRGKKLERLNAEIAREFSGKIRVMRGIELNVTGFGKSDCPKDRHDYDVVIIGYHKGVLPFNKHALGIWGESLLGIRNDPHRNAEGILEAAAKCRADIISHPNLYLKVDIPSMAKCCRELGILLEVNSARVTLTSEEIRLIKDSGCGLIIGSDAHSPDRVGDFALASASVTSADAWDAVRNAVKA